MTSTLTLWSSGVGGLTGDCCFSFSDGVCGRVCGGEEDLGDADCGLRLWTRAGQDQGRAEKRMNG